VLHLNRTLLHLLAAATAKASAAGAESREAKSRNPSTFLLVPNQETLHRGEKKRRVGWGLTGEKTTAGWDGRAGAAAADQLYATAATEETPSGRPALGGVAVRSRLHLLTRSAATAAAAPARRLARRLPSHARRSRDFSREVALDDFFPVSTSLG
jgi:hypothetical protein